MRIGKLVVAGFIISIVMGVSASTPANAGEAPSPPSPTLPSECATTIDDGVSPLAQWAICATGDDWYDGDFLPQNATGAPDADGCDENGLWASFESDAIASITLRYDYARVPSEINVYQNDLQGAISQIEVSADGVVWTTVHTGDPSLVTAGTCLEENSYDDMLSVSVTSVDTPISFVRITVDQTSNENNAWAEIDAVQLVGSVTLPEPTTTTLPEPTTTTLPEPTTTEPNLTDLPATGNHSSSTVALSLMLILSGVFIASRLRRRLG
jgi:LPXTG-motif cell wall-anchored protein